MFDWLDNREKKSGWEGCFSILAGTFARNVSTRSKENLFFQHVLITLHNRCKQKQQFEEATVQHLESTELQRSVGPGTPMLKGSKKATLIVYCGS